MYVASLSSRYGAHLLRTDLQLTVTLDLSLHGGMFLSLDVVPTLPQVAITVPGGKSLLPSAAPLSIAYNIAMSSPWLQGTGSAFLECTGVQGFSEC